MIIRSKQDYDSIISNLKNKANEVNGTYEVIGDSYRFIGTTECLNEMFGITSDFEREFLNAISTFKKCVVGPYITEKYFNLIPGLKTATKQLFEDGINTRRCVVKFPAEHCFQTIQFMIRENTVHVICHMRSCDAVKNLPCDMWLCSKLGDIFADFVEETLGIRPYEYRAITMMFGSLHVYKEDVNVL